MEDDQQFCLRWNNHQSTLIAVFDTLLENGTLVDCTLAAEGKYLNAHKVVLSACSPYFESLLSQNYDKHPIFILKDVKYQELKAMMDYMYRGEVNISQDQLSALLRAAESLQIKGLSENRKGGGGDASDHPAPAKKAAVASSGGNTVAAAKVVERERTLPKGQGLTIEQRRKTDVGGGGGSGMGGGADDGGREGSISPGPSRRRKRARRKSTDTDDHLNHHDGASNSSESHQSGSTTTTTTMMTKAIATADVPAPIDTKADILQAAALSNRGSSDHHRTEPASTSTSTVPMMKEKQEPPSTSTTNTSTANISQSEVMLEPKAEYIDDMNEDSIEDLTLDDDDLSNMEQMEDGAGPSGHGMGGESSQDPIGLRPATGAPSTSTQQLLPTLQPFYYLQQQQQRQRYLELKIHSRNLLKQQRQQDGHQSMTTSMTTSTPNTPPIVSGARIRRKPKRYITETEETDTDEENTSNLVHLTMGDLLDPLSLDPNPNPPLIPILNNFTIESNAVQGAQYDVDLLMYGLGANMRKYAPETVRWALDAILNRGASVTAASQASGIKRTSLHLYLKKLNIRKVKYDSGGSGPVEMLSPDTGAVKQEGGIHEGGAISVLEIGERYEGDQEDEGKYHENAEILVLEVGKDGSGSHP